MYEYNLYKYDVNKMVASYTHAIIIMKFNLLFALRNESQEMHNGLMSQKMKRREERIKQLPYTYRPY